MRGSQVVAPVTAQIHGSLVIGVYDDDVGPIFASETGGENRKLKSEKRNEEAGIKHIGRSILVRCVEGGQDISTKCPVAFSSRIPTVHSRCRILKNLES